jgi:uncharacterized RmlC-like cupin family protein
VSTAQSTQTGASCALVKLGSTYAGKQGFNYFEGVSKQSVGSQAICMHLLTIPPKGRASVHLHESHETAIYVISGHGDMWYGEQLEQHMAFEAGDMIYIPAGVPHLPSNTSAEEPCTAVIARTDPNEQESVVLRPDLEALAPPLQSTIPEPSPV